MSNLHTGIVQEVGSGKTVNSTTSRNFVLFEDGLKLKNISLSNYVDDHIKPGKEITIAYVNAGKKTLIAGAKIGNETMGTGGLVPISIGVFIYWLFASAVLFGVGLLVVIAVMDKVTDMRFEEAMPIAIGITSVIPAYLMFNASKYIYGLWSAEAKLKRLK